MFWSSTDCAGCDSASSGHSNFDMTLPGMKPGREVEIRCADTSGIGKLADQAAVSFAFASGRIFWFTRKKLSGSYFALIWTSLSKLP